MQQGAAVKLKTCIEMGRCNKMPVSAATVMQVFAALLACCRLL